MNQFHVIIYKPAPTLTIDLSSNKSKEEILPSWPYKVCIQIFKFLSQNLIVPSFEQDKIVESEKRTSLFI